MRTVARQPSMYMNLTRRRMMMSIQRGMMIAFFAVVALVAQAGQYWWAGDGVNLGGTGPWNTAASNWRSGSASGSFVAWPSSATDSTAVLGGTAGTLTIAAGGVAANRVAATAASFTVAGGPLALNGTTPSITNSVAVTINSNLTGSGGLAKLGDGMLTLGGNNAGLSGTLTISGATSGNNGGVQVQSTAAFGNIANVSIANNSFLNLVGATTGAGVPISVAGGGGTGAPAGALKCVSGNSVVNGSVTFANNAVRLGNFGGTSLTFNGAVTSQVGSAYGVLIRYADNQGVIFTNTANYWEAITVVASGSVYCYPGALPTASRLQIAASGNAWFETSGTFTRSLGTASAGQVEFNSTAGRTAGLSARGGDLTVNFGGAGAAITWGSTAGFNPVILGLAGANATGTLTLENPINLNAAVRTIDVANGVAATDAILSGTLSGTGSSGLNKTGGGALLLTGVNTYAGLTTIIGGKLAGVVGGSCSNSAVTVSNTVGCVLGVSITDNSKQWTCAALTFAGSNTGLEFDFGAAVKPSTTTAPLQINGNVAFTGTTAVTIKAGSLTSGTANYPLMSWTGTCSGSAPATATLPANVNGFLYVSGNTLYLNVLAPSLTWDITDTSDQTINDGNGTWSTTDALWNDGTSNDVNVAWDNASNAEDIAAFGSTTNGTVNVLGAITLGGITFNSIPGTNVYAVTGGSLTTTNSGALTIINNDSGNDRRTSGGALIGSKLTGNMSLVFAGSGDNVILGNSGNDFVGEIRMSGGGVQISSNAQLGNVSNRLAVIDAGSYLRNSAAITVGHDIVLSSGRVLQFVNGGNLLTHTGVISGGDANSMLVIGAGHGPGNGGHRVYLHGSNTLSGTIRVYDQLRAYEGEGLSANANLTLGNAIGGSVNSPNTAGILETSGDFVRTVGTGAGQFQWATDSYHSGGFAAVGGPLTVSLGGNADPAALTWAGTSGFLISGAELRFQNNNANGAVTWRNPVNFNGALRTVYIGASSYAVTLDAALSGTGNSGLIKAGTGMLVLAADSSYAGLTVISAGTLQVGNGSFSGTLGAGTVTNNSKFVINRSNDYNLTNLIVGSGTLLKLGAGTLTLSAANTYSGATTVSNGTLAAGCDGALNGNSSLFLSGGTFDAGSVSNALGALTLSAGSANALTVNSGCRLSFTGLNGTGTLVVAGKLGPTSLRIGTSANSVTLPQLKQISTSNGGSVYLDANGYVLATPQGTLLRLL